MRRLLCIVSAWAFLSFLVLPGHLVRADAQPLIGVYMDTIGFLLDLRLSPPLLLVVDGSPAVRAGLQSGDRLIALDDQDIQAVLPTILQKLQGPPGSTLKLTVKRGDQTLSVTTERGQPRAVPLETILFPYPAPRVWDAVIDTITSGELVFASRGIAALGRRGFSFAHLYRVKSVDRTLGVIICERFDWGEEVPLREATANYNSDIEAISDGPRGLLVIWTIIRITPTIRISDRNTVTAVRISLAMEAHNTLSGWGPVRSKWTLESTTFLAITSRLTR